MPAIKLRHSAIFCLAAVLLSCGPPDQSSGDPFAQHERDLRKAEADKEAAIAFRPPPEIARTLGISADDTRAEIVLLQAAGNRPYETFQRMALSTLVANQKGLKLTTHDAEGKASSQRNQLRTALDKKPAAIILDAINESGAKNSDLSILLELARSSGVTVIGLDSRIAGCTTIVHCDPAEIGREAATLCIDALKRKAAEEGKTEPSGRIVQLRADEPSTWSTGVADGFGSGLRSASGPVLVHDAPCNWSGDVAMQRLHEALRIQKQFDVLFCHSDAIAAAASKFASQQGFRENVLIIGTEALPGREAGLQLVRSGDIDGTIARPPLVDLALLIIVKMRADPAFKPEPHYEVVPLSVTPKNVHLMVRQSPYKLPKL